MVCTAQVNLVPNPGFETFTTCPVGFSQYNGYVGSWTDPSAASPDYMNACANPFPAGVPKNGTGWQQPHGGTAYSGCYTTAGTYREYIQVQLSSPLVAGTSYLFKMYVVLHNKSQWATDDIGAYFSVVAPTSTGTGFLPGSPLPQVGNAPGNVITDTVNWQLISGTFTAAGGERYLTIGHLKPDALSTYQQVSFGSQGAYYYIDDVSVVANNLLPVELLDFSAEAHVHDIVLNWTTATEHDNAGFELRRSLDGINEEPIGWVDGQGCSLQEEHYAVTDATAAPGIRYYYRLVQFDENGAAHPLGMSSAMIPGGNAFDVSASDGTILITVPTDGEVLEEWFDARGALLRQVRRKLATGAHQLDRIASPAGLLIARVTFGAEVRSVRVLR
jgi:hypothetical protein